MTDNEIIKALKCCMTANCLDCHECPMALYRDCCNILMSDSLALINRQKAEIERLQKYHDSMEKAIYSFREDQAEVKFFKDRIRAVAVKGFAERLRAKAYTNNYWHEVVLVSEIDNLVKEFSGEQT